MEIQIPKDTYKGLIGLATAGFLSLYNENSILGEPYDKFEDFELFEARFKYVTFTLLADSLETAENFESLYDSLLEQHTSLINESDNTIQTKIEDYDLQSN